MPDVIDQVSYVTEQFEAMGATKPQLAQEWIKLLTRPTYRLRWYSFLSEPAVESVDGGSKPWVTSQASSSQRY